VFTTLALAAAVTPAAPLPSDTGRAPTGPAPWVVHLKADDAGQVRLYVRTPRTLKQTRTIIEIQNGQQVQKQVVQDVQTYTTTVLTLNNYAGPVTASDGGLVAAAELARRAKEPTGVTVLVSADGKAVDRAWLGAVAPGTIVLAGEAFANTTAAPQMPFVANRLQPATQAPRLALLTPGPDGKVRVVVRAPGGNTAEVRAAILRLQLLNNGNGAIPLMLDDVNGIPTGGPEERALADTGFDAYELDGRLVPRAEALGRLRAGGDGAARRRRPAARPGIPRVVPQRAGAGLLRGIDHARRRPGRRPEAGAGAHPRSATGGACLRTRARTRARPSTAGCRPGPGGCAGPTGGAAATGQAGEPEGLIGQRPRRAAGRRPTPVRTQPGSEPRGSPGTAGGRRGGRRGGCRRTGPPSRHGSRRSRWRRAGR
jgi:hypothetical protein